MESNQDTCDHMKFFWSEPDIMPLASNHNRHGGYTMTIRYINHQPRWHASLKLGILHVNNVNIVYGSSYHGDNGLGNAGQHDLVLFESLLGLF